ncbi:cysteine dioxygenase [Streptomyces tateyamensis]|uniref:Cysteine dioxygenase n=1 Tax=Streptomyces tateyamensis TaxID=565073 RepID=A0A2V4NM86_9ACTN|nr:cysteine dioxygenase [Streptomyces tateyamensis]PYC80849.1 cysteine dioxygenase [Streptomyces tateyamensis]
MPLTPAALRGIVADLAERPEEWIGKVRLAAEDRWYERLSLTEEHEVWLISWLPGHATGFHDHGGSRGAFAVALGELEELSLGSELGANDENDEPGGPGGPGRPRHHDDHGQLRSRRLTAGTTRAFGPQFLHDVRNTGTGPAVSLHAYSPPLSEIARFELRAGGLRPTVVEGADQW